MGEGIGAMIRYACPMVDLRMAKVASGVRCFKDGPSAYEAQRRRKCLDVDPGSGSRADADSAALDGLDRPGRFDRREGHDLERLLWPGDGQRRQRRPAS